MDTKLTLRNWSDPTIAVPASGDRVYLITVTYSDPFNGSRRLIVEGIAFNSATVHLAAAVAGNADVSVSGATSSIGLFSVTVSVPGLCCINRP